jgi:cytochrome P450/NADPH-cytochrome P450 reductase
MEGILHPSFLAGIICTKRPQPFGTGVRACIGRAFAWQEALMVLAMLLQNFNFQLDDPSYTLRIKQTLTIKPANLKIRATLRHGMNAVDLEHTLHGVPPPGAAMNSTMPSSKDSEKPAVESARKPLKRTQTGMTPQAPKRSITVLYGSNTGTCQTFAERLTSTATRNGLNADIKDMDAATAHISKGQTVIIITASYEGGEFSKFFCVKIVSRAGTSSIGLSKRMVKMLFESCGF